MRKLFTILTAMLMVGVASVNAETTESFTTPLKGDNCGYTGTSGDGLDLTMMCTTESGTQISGATQFFIYTRYANNVITRIVFRVVSEANGGVSALNYTYTREGNIVTISDLEALSVTIACPYAEENAPSFIIDSIAVTYKESENTIIRLTPGQEGADATVDNTTIHSNYYTGAAYIDPNAGYSVTISSTEGNVPDLRCYIFTGTAEGKAGLTATNCNSELSASGNWFTITNATSNSVVITSSAAYVAFQYFVLGAGGGSTPSGSTEQVDVIYKDKASAELDTEEITLHLPAAPEVEGFTFLKWVVVGGDLDNGIIIQATYQTNTPTAMPAVVPVPGNAAQKLVREGNIYILKGDKTYTVQGQQVK